MRIRLTTSYVPVGKKKIPYKCNDCGNENCLEFTFLQTHLKSDYTEQVTKNVSATLFCYNTNTEIPKKKWSKEVKNYSKIEKSKVKLEPSSFKFTNFFYRFMGVLAVFFIGVFVYIWWTNYSHSNKKEVLSKAEKGLKVKVDMYSLRGTEEGAKAPYTWYVINKIALDTIWLQQHKNLNTQQSGSFNLDASEFTGEIIKASFNTFKNNSVFKFTGGTQKYIGMIDGVKEE